MKLGNLKIKAMAALATMILSTAASQAGITYASDDLLLGFRQAGNGTSDLVVDLGAASAFRDATAPITLTLTNFASTATSLFGAGNANVTFGLFGTTQNTAANGDPIRVLYASEPTGNTGTPIQSSSQSGPANTMLNVANNYIAAPSSAISNSGVGNPGDANSFTTKVQVSFGSNNLSPVENALTGGLDLYRVPQTVNGPVKFEGNFVYSGGDTFTFTPTAVPEPSTAALGGLVVLGLAFRRHRKSVLA